MTIGCRIGFSVSLILLGAALPASGLANRVFVSARSGNDANSCANILTPCQTFAGAVTQLNPDGELIVLDSGGYGPVTITQGITIEAPSGVTAFVHPPAGDAITVNAGVSDVVTLRGLVLNGGAGNGVTANSFGTLNVENCFITGFSAVNAAGIQVLSGGRLNFRNTSVRRCYRAVDVVNTSGLAEIAIGYCHFDDNMTGFTTETTAPGGSATTAVFSTADNNHAGNGWTTGANDRTGHDVLNLEFCSGSENSGYGLLAGNTNANQASAALYSTCVFANNGQYGVSHLGSAGTVQTRGNNTITGNAAGATLGTIGPFSPM